MSFSHLWPLDWPDELRVRSCAFTPVNIASKTSSIYTGQQRVHFHSSFLRFQVTTSLLKQSDSSAVRVFFMSLSGIAGTFKFRDPAVLNKGSLTIGEITFADNIHENKVSIEGSSGYTLFPGDWLRLESNNQLCMVVGVNDLISTVKEVTLSPAPRTSDLLGTSVNCINPYGIFRLEEDVTLNTDVLRHSNLTFAIREAF